MKLRKLISFFDKLEDKVRGKLSHHPIAYSLVGAVGIILVWKGIWETAEVFPVLHGPGSLLLGVFILLSTGLLVSFFIGDTIIISGLKREKKLAEKTEADILKAEADTTEKILNRLEHIEKDIHDLRGEELPGRERVIDA